MALTSQRLSRSVALQDASTNSPPLRRRARGAGVWIVQQALVDLGFPMPVSTRKYNSPDGIYGSETVAKVRQFQRKNRLGPDGIVGKNTLKKFDQLLQHHLCVGMIYEVPLIPQNHGMGCWAASISMMVAWKETQSVAPIQVATQCGYVAQLTTGLDAHDRTPLNSWGLVSAMAQSYTPQAFYDLLADYGPLWVAAAVPGPHVRVITGIHLGGSAATTVIFINDPWQTGMAVFHAANRGSRYTESYARYDQRQRNLAYTEIAHHPNGYYVAHWPERLGSTCGGGPSR